MSIFYSQDHREHFVNYFCSQPLEITKILDFHPEPQEALVQGQKKNRMNPHDLYEKLIVCRNEHAERFTSEQQLKICESNLEILAERCCVEHKKYSIEPRETGVRGFFNRLFHRGTSHNEAPPQQKNVPEKQENQPAAKAQNPAEQNPILDLLKIVCFGPLPLPQILALAPRTEKLCAMQSEERSPHVLYQQLVGIRDKYARMIQPQHLSNFEKNLEVLAFVCCENHVRYDAG